ncbi:hypothetical protein [Gloeobacter kilaueensis]|uniref:Uncharacterized protein n=1 Tax=Gloeobacter kilaueensis (strain ATCC BAA-2537 / CCAP 1431/1 / ULC 316 / JS1) TaxID=1183438 RepID=U5QBK4_GLOK1|nr:hypothetical protein [Gloeobacter kilaueensis]AGY56277.1 hypothetical protein GKIL_0030 [Gloeobacter kilaueensis JS1]
MPLFVQIKNTIQRGCAGLLVLCLGITAQSAAMSDTRAEKLLSLAEHHTSVAQYTSGLDRVAARCQEPRLEVARLTLQAVQRARTAGVLVDARQMLGQLAGELTNYNNPQSCAAGYELVLYSLEG